MALLTRVWYMAADVDSSHESLGIPEDYGCNPRLPRYAEPATLEDVGPNIVGRMQKLTPRAALAWHQMVRQAHAQHITLLLVSGFRSVAYQSDLIRQKLARGETIEQILKVNAAPGYSQHHTGEALDVATPGCRPLTEAFEKTPAFAWLEQYARGFGFTMPYSRDNPHGFIYEPWHWCLATQYTG